MQAAGIRNSTYATSGSGWRINHKHYINEKSGRAELWQSCQILFYPLPQAYPHATIRHVKKVSLQSEKSPFRYYLATVKISGNAFCYSEKPFRHSLLQPSAIGKQPSAVLIRSLSRRHTYCLAVPFVASRLVIHSLLQSHP